MSNCLRFILFTLLFAFLGLVVILPHTAKFNPQAVETLVHTALIVGVCYLGVFVLVLFEGRQ